MGLLVEKGGEKVVKGAGALEAREKLGGPEGAHRAVEHRHEALPVLAPDGDHEDDADDGPSPANELPPISWTWK